MRKGGGSVAVLHDNRSGAASYWEGGHHHSVADRHGVSLAPYVHAAFGLLVQKNLRHVLVIGCGGGSIATLLARAGVRVSLSDIDPASFAIAWRYFHMPVSVDCHICDGAKLLRRSPTRYDAIVVDAFVGGEIPDHFLTPNFLRLAKRRLKRGGIVLFNIVILGDDDPLPDRLTHAMRRQWRDVRSWDAGGPGSRNLIATAGAVKSLKKPRLRVRPATGARRLINALQRFSLRALP